MKALVIIAAIVLAIWSVVDFVWFRALNERAGDLKEVSDKLDKLDQKLNEKAELLDTRAAELKDYEKALDDMKVSLVADNKKAKKK